MSEDEAYLRINAARVGRRFPRVLSLFAEGMLHLTAIKLLRPHLTPDNHVQVLERRAARVSERSSCWWPSLLPGRCPAGMRKLPDSQAPTSNPRSAEVASGHSEADD